MRLRREGIRCTNCGDVIAIRMAYGWHFFDEIIGIGNHSYGICHKKKRSWKNFFKKLLGYKSKSYVSIYRING